MCVCVLGVLLSGHRGSAWAHHEVPGASADLPGSSVPPGGHLAASQGPTWGPEGHIFNQGLWDTRAQAPLGTGGGKEEHVFLGL